MPSLAAASSRPSSQQRISSTAGRRFCTRPPAPRSPPNQRADPALSQTRLGSASTVKSSAREASTETSAPAAAERTPREAGAEWLPPVPDLGGLRPRSAWAPGALAYLGDAVFELYVRRFCLLPPSRAADYNKRVKTHVRAEAQDALLRRLLATDWLLDRERDVLKWGRNAGLPSSGAPKRFTSTGTTVVYRSASSFETLLGYLYLSDSVRLHELMAFLGYELRGLEGAMFQELADLDLGQVGGE